MESAVHRVRSALVVLLIAAGALSIAHPAAATSPGFNGRIVFTRAAIDSPASAVYTVNPDGTGLTQLTTGGIYPSYSSDGSQISYLGQGGIREMNADGTDDQLILAEGSIGFRLSWSPDKSKFAFIKSVNGFATVTVANADGSGRYQLFADDAYHEFDPAWSPDGTQLIFAKQAMSSSDGDLSGIWVSDADGANARRVATRPMASLYASFSPDGSQIVYDNGTSLVVMNSDGTDAHPVGNIRGAAAFSPDGKWLLVSWNGEGDPRSSPGIWLMRADGSGARQITQGPDFLAEWQPLSAPQPVHNGKIVFDSVGESNAQTLSLMNADGTERVTFPNVVGTYPTWSPDGASIGLWQGSTYVTGDNSGNNVETHPLDAGSFPVRSPDGKKLAYAKSVTLSPSWQSDHVFVSDLDGSNATDLTPNDLTTSFFPAWSPDGTRLAFMHLEAEPAPHDSVWIMNADGTDAHAVPNQPDGRNGLASFSPDGTKLVFVNAGSTTARVAVIGVDGSGLTKIGPTDRFPYFPSFSPDGTKIAYGNNAPGEGFDDQSGIFVMDTDGTNLHRLTRGHDQYPKWQPRLAVPNLPPRAIGTAQNKQPRALFANAGPSWDADGAIVKYEWRWGDNTAMSPYRYVWHKYTKAGTYLVRLTVTDNNGARTTIKAWVMVN